MGRVYGLHFWGYPLATAPVKVLLRVAGGNEFRAPQITNTLLLLAVAAAILGGRWAPEDARWAAALGLVGPAAWFCVWPHPEVFSCSLTLLGLALAQAGRFPAGTLSIAVASVQNPPLAVLAFAVAARGLWIRRGGAFTIGALLHAAAPLVPALVPPLFYLWSFGRPSLLAPESVAWSHASAGKALALLADPNIGLLPHAPGIVALAAWSLAGRRTEAALPPAMSWALWAVMAFACTTTANWNHGTSGPSRYAVWLLPLLALAAGAVRPRRGGAHLLAAALALQAALVATRFGAWGTEDHMRHSPLARALLRVAPAAYDPSPDLFAGRTRQLGPAGPFLHRTDRCHKALAQKRHAGVLEAVCGVDPPAYAAWRRTIAEADRGRDRWTYVNY
jgi:hypothetical protein